MHAQIRVDCWPEINECKQVTLMWATSTWNNMHGFMYVYIYICSNIFVCMYVCMYTHTYTHWYYRHKGTCHKQGHTSLRNHAHLACVYVHMHKMYLTSLPEACLSSSSRNQTTILKANNIKRQSFQVVISNKDITQTLGLHVHGLQDAVCCLQSCISLISQGYLCTKKTSIKAALRSGLKCTTISVQIWERMRQRSCHELSFLRTCILAKTHLFLVYLLHLAIL